MTTNTFQCKEFIQIVWIKPCGCKIVLQQSIPRRSGELPRIISYLEDCQTKNTVGLTYDMRYMFILRAARKNVFKTLKN